MSGQTVYINPFNSPASLCGFYSYFYCNIPKKFRQNCPVSKWPCSNHDAHIHDLPRLPKPTMSKLSVSKGCVKPAHWIAWFGFCRPIAQASYLINDNSSISLGTSPTTLTVSSLWWLFGVSLAAQHAVALSSGHPCPPWFGDLPPSLQIRVELNTEMADPAEAC